MDHVDGHKYSRTGGNHSSRTGDKFERKTGRRAGSHGIEHDPGPPPKTHVTTRETRARLQAKADTKKRKKTEKARKKQEAEERKAAKQRRGTVNTTTGNSGW